MEHSADFQQLLRLAQSPAGQQLIALLQHSGGAQLDAAVQKYAAGDYTAAKKTLSSLLDSPEAKKLLRQLEDSQ